MSSASLSFSISTPTFSVASPRKRTMSFSSPQPTKSARTPLRRTGSFLSLADMEEAAREERTNLILSSLVSPSSQTRPLRPHKEQRHQRKSHSSSIPESSHVIHQKYFVAHLSPSKPAYSPPPQPKSSFPRLRTSSPLSPKRCLLPARASFPRSKAEPDLYRTAITARMRLSPEGQKILHMGPRIALGIHAATQDLERLVASQHDRDGDLSMVSEEPPMTASWVVVPPEDWEMVDCSA